MRTPAIVDITDQEFDNYDEWESKVTSLCLSGFRVHTYDYGRPEMGIPVDYDPIDTAAIIRNIGKDAYNAIVADEYENGSWGYHWFTYLAAGDEKAVAETLELYGGFDAQ